MQIKTYEEQRKPTQIFTKGRYERPGEIKRREGWTRNKGTLREDKEDMRGWCFVANDMLRVVSLLLFTCQVWLCGAMRAG